MSVLFFACKTEKKTNTLPTAKTVTPYKINYAKGFSIEKQGALTILKVHSPWANAEASYTYALIPRDKAASITLDRNAYDAIVLTPVKRLVVTSTTHIPTLEALGVEHTLVGFPDTKYISSEKTRTRIEQGEVKELGRNEQINTELLIDLEPELVIGFSVSNSNATYDAIQKAGIPVVYNGDWTATTPLGRAEWIKFFAPFFEKEKTADTIFATIEKNYKEAKALAQKATKKPTVLSGAMFKDVWYMAAGDSFQAQFLKDANTNYLWQDSKGTGSLSLSLESVLDKGHAAEYWIAPGQFTRYDQLLDKHKGYSGFDAFQNRKIYTFAATKGKTGGLLYYELAPNRPDIVLKDIIHYVHPELLPNYKPSFFKPLE